MENSKKQWHLPAIKQRGAILIALRRVALTSFLPKSCYY